MEQDNQRWMYPRGIAREDREALRAGRLGRISRRVSLVLFGGILLLVVGFGLLFVGLFVHGILRWHQGKLTEGGLWVSLFFTVFVGVFCRWAALKLYASFRRVYQNEDLVFSVEGRVEVTDKIYDYDTGAITVNIGEKAYGLDKKTAKQLEPTRRYRFFIDRMGDTVKGIEEIEGWVESVGYEEKK